MERDIKYIIIHCADTPNGRWTTAADIDAWHKARGFKRSPGFRARQEPRLEAIGYHFVIGTNGGIWNGRHADEIGAHAKGFNSCSIGICLVGRDKFSPAQWETLKGNIQAQRRKYPSAQVIGHRQVNDGKTCPGFDVQVWLKNKMEPLPDHILVIDDA